MALSTNSNEKVPLWRDERVWHISLQALVIMIVVAIALGGLGHMNRNLQQLGRQFEFSFLLNRAGFNIGESVIPYKPDDPYYWAFIVGIVNTLRLILVSFITTTVLGVVVGIASFSDNWLLRKINVMYVEIVRNTPLLLQFVFFYFVVLFGLTNDADIKGLPGSIWLSKKGIWIPFPANTVQSWIATVVLIGLAIAAILIWRWRLTQMEEQGTSGQPQQMMLISIGVVGFLALIFGLGWQFPHVTESKDITGGLRMSLEYGAMLLGLSFYTGAYVAEIVRAGIESVSKGQWEAAKSLGFRPTLSMRLVVFPQALRIIVPSLNSQYITLTKNSSLALAIGYPDTFATAQTTLNQTGRAIEVVLLMVITYLVLNLIISIVMNQLNRVVQIKER